MKLLLVSHGAIAEGFHSTLTNFFGASDVYFANVSLETGTTGLLEKVNAYLNDWKDDRVVICSDLKGGSANQSICQFASRENTYIVSGMNLSLLLQLITAGEINSDILHTFIADAKEDIVLVNDVLNAKNDSEDDE